MEIKYIHREEQHNITSPSIILPLILDILKPVSLIDIGCGIGTWLSVAKSLGINDVLGIDGEYVDKVLLRKYLKENEFLSKDLTRTVDLGRRFDLALCLEVAEHLPESAADILVQTLVRHSDVIVFSAAIPFQGGQNHLNEQKPQYWIDKFVSKGYNVYDPIRSIIWEMEEIDVWYKQNLFLFSKFPLDIPKPTITYLIHPDLYRNQMKKKIQYESELIKVKTGKFSFKFYLNRLIKKVFE